MLKVIVERPQIPLFEHTFRRIQFIVRLGLFQVGEYCKYEIALVFGRLISRIDLLNQTQTCKNLTGIAHNQAGTPLNGLY